MRSLMLSVVLGGVLLATAARAQYPGDPNYYQPPMEDPQAQPGYGGVFTYGGVHPIPYEVGSGFCTVGGAHTHPYQPFDGHLFQQVNNAYYFVGDPYDFGYTQSLSWYRGNHPIPVELGGGYCYMDWAHRHNYAPSQSVMMYYRNVGGHWAYRGPFDQPYYQHRDRYVSYYNDYYRSNYYGNRYYRTRPSHVYRGWRWNQATPVVVQPQPYQPRQPMVHQPPVVVQPQPYQPQPRVWGVPRPHHPGYVQPGYVQPGYVQPVQPSGTHYAPAAPAYGVPVRTGGGYVPPPAPVVR